MTFDTLNSTRGGGGLHTGDFIVEEEKKVKLNLKKNNIIFNKSFLGYADGIIRACINEFEAANYAVEVVFFLSNSILTILKFVFVNLHF